MTRPDPVTMCSSATGIEIFPLFLVVIVYNPDATVSMQSGACSLALNL